MVLHKTQKNRLSRRHPLKYKGTLWDKPKDKAEILNEQFKSVFSNPTPDELEPPVSEIDRPYLDIDELQIHQMVYQNY